MVQELIKKSKLNVHSMLRHGSVAVITLFSVGILFGAKNAMIAFPIALTSTVMGRQNFHVKTSNKVMRIILVDLTIVIVSHVSSLNMFWGIPINFISVFLIMYTIISPYDLTFYKPFLMLYIFTQYASVPTSQLYLRIMAVILGIGIVILASVIKKTNDKSLLGRTINISIGYIRRQLENILNNCYDENLQEKCSIAMRELAYKIYITRHKGYLTTNLGKIQFRLFLSIENLNLSLKSIDEHFKNNVINREYVVKIKEVIGDIIEYEQGNIQLSMVENKLKKYKTLWGEKLNNTVFIYQSKEENCITQGDFISNIESIIEAVSELEGLGTREVNKIYDQWERTDLDRPKVAFKEYLGKNSIRFKFAIRMSFTMTLALFLGDYLGYYKIIWAIITIMSIMQPYYEETISKARERFVGNVLAILVTGIVINVTNSRFITMIFLVISLYLLYGFKEYYKISLFAGVASICMASLTQEINVLIVYRIIYVVIGVVIVRLVNKYVFPYRLMDGIHELVVKITRIKVQLISDVKEVEKNKFKEHEIRDLVIHSTLLSQKLYLRNLQCNIPDIDNFIKDNNRFVILMTYNSLRKVKRIK